MDLFETLGEALRPVPMWELQLPHGIREYANKLFKEELDGLDYPDLYVLPLTPEGEAEREYLINYHHNENGKLIHTSIYRCGAYEHNFEYEGETYLAILVNND